MKPELTSRGRDDVSLLSAVGAGWVIYINFLGAFHVFDQFHTYERYNKSTMQLTA